MGRRAGSDGRFRLFRGWSVDEEMASSVEGGVGPGRPFRRSISSTDRPRVGVALIPRWFSAGCCIRLLGRLTGRPFRPVTGMLGCSV